MIDDAHSVQTPEQFLSALEEGQREIKILVKGKLDQSADTVFNMFKEKGRNVRRLVLDNAGLSDKKGALLFDSLMENNSLLRLEVSGNYLGTKSASSVMNFLKVNNTLVSLDLTDNTSIGKTALLISVALKKNTTLQHLMLAKCSIPPEALIDLAKSLEINTGLLSFSIDRNQNSSKVAAAFGEMLKKNTTLQNLAMRGGSKTINNDGAIALAEGLKVNTSLLNLSLPKNKIKDAGATAFGKMLAVNSTLQRLDIEKNKYTAKGLANLLEGMKLNTSMEQIFLDSGTDEQKAIQDIATKNMLQRKSHERSLLKNLVFSEDTKGPLNRCKLMVIGRGMAGKTATVRSLMGKRFEEKWRSTVGASVQEVKVNRYKGWERLGHKEKVELTRDLAAVLTKQKAAAEKQNASSQPEGTLAEGENLKGDTQLLARLNDTGIAENEADNTAMEGKVPESFQKETIYDSDDEALKHPMTGAQEVANKVSDAVLKGAKNEEGSIRFSIWDYGGQRVFYSLHHLFMTKHGVFMLVFDMRNMIDEQKRPACVTYLNFWMNVIKLHAGETPLMIVGTYREVIDQSQFPNIESQLKQLLEGIGSAVVQNSSEGLSFFPVSNKEGAGVSNLRQGLELCARDLESTKMEIRLTWLYTLETLLQRREKWITLSDFRIAAANNRVTDELEVRKMLDLFHSLGMIVYLTQTSALSEVVTLNSQWLITSIGRILRDKTLHKLNEKMLKEEKLELDGETMFSKGIVTERLIRFLWNDSQVEYLLDLMRQTSLLVDYKYPVPEIESVSPGKLFFVPKLLSGADDFDVEAPISENFSSDLPETFFGAGVERKVVFHFQFLPDGIFDRLIALCVGRMNLMKVEKPPKVESGSCEVGLGKGVFVLLKEFRRSRMLTLEVVEDEDNNASDAIVIMQSVLKKMKADIFGQGLLWEIKFPQTGNSMLSYEEAQAKKLQPWFSDGSAEKEFGGFRENMDIDSFLAGLQNL